MFALWCEQVLRPRRGRDKPLKVNMDNKFFIYFSQILGQEVRDEKNRRLGWAYDICFKVDGEIYPRSSSLVIKRGLLFKNFAYVPWDKVVQIEKFVKNR